MAAFTLNLQDMIFILRQIKVSEAHATGTALTEIYVDADGNVVAANSPGALLAIPDPHVPVGLRTVDGTYNNIVPGRETWGAADQPMPRLLDGSFVNDADGDTFDPDGPGPASVTNTDYGIAGNVADADPRLISNLVVDMSMNNPAAVLAALTFAGSEDPQGDLERLMAGRVTELQAAAALVAAQAAVLLAESALDDAVTAYTQAPSSVTIDAIQDAAAALSAAEATLAHAELVDADPAAAFIALAQELGLTLNEQGSLVIPNISPDEGLSKPFNAWMTFFGQFFDHGLDLITKGNNGTVYIPLQADDPLYDKGLDGIAGTSDDGHTNFMVLTRATPDPDTGSQTNTTTAFVDQNQTYTSHPSHQVFLREYKFSQDTNDADSIPDARPVATGKLLDGSDNGLPTWKDIKLQAREFLGIELTDRDVVNLPLLRTDLYGEFIRGPNGLPLLVLGVGADGVPNTADDIVVEGNLANPVNTFTATNGTLIGAVRTGHAFLDDIAHNAVPTGVYDPDGPGGPLLDTPIAADSDDVAGNAIAMDYRGRKVAYDDELLDAHFITGDGRGNENIGLTAVHHIFHSEHNRQVDTQRLTILQSGDIDFINEWLVGDITALDPAFASMNAVQRLAYSETLDWDGERLFQAGRFATEMQYQHLVFEEFARKVQPAIDPFVFNNITDINPSIFSEFANTVYRFGHSMLTESMPRIHLNANGSITADDMGLITAFLNPLAFNSDGTAFITADQAAGAIVRGMTIERGNEIDEFITGALRNNLLGLPLDLASINIARGRDTGIPSLNDARTQLFGATGSSFLTPYDSWTDFAANLKNPISVVNFIAAYGTHSSVTAQTTVAGKRDAAWALVFGEASGSVSAVPSDRFNFLNSTGTWSAANSGLNTIDLWIGGLAEKQMEFGGFLGSTFNAIFEAQLEALQDGDRLYYLTRTQGQNFLHMLEQNSFAKLIMANTDIAQPGPDGVRGTADDVISRHIGVDAFAAYDFILEVNAANQVDYNGAADGVDPVGTDAALEAMGLGKLVRNDPGTAGLDANYLRFTGGEHALVGGTTGNDTIITDFGDDGIWGDDGNDRIESGAGVDLVNGGGGDDIITDSGDTGDFIKGDEGNDVIANSNGIDILMGGTGKDVIFVGVDDTEVFGGEGDDFIAGGDGVDLLMGNEGDDWIEAGGGFDTTAGDNSELFFNSTIVGHDVMFSGNEEHDFDAESGDDIMVQGESVMRNEGMFGFDWAIFKGMALNGYADMNIPIFTTEQADILRNRFDKVEALSGWDHDDTLIGDSRLFGDIAAGATIGTTEGVFFNDGLDQAGINRIQNLAQIVQVGATGYFESGNILLGGAGSDNLRGNGGDDILDGDRWLNVRIGIHQNADGSGPEIATVDSMRHVFPDNFAITAWQGKSLFELLVDRTVVPTQMQIVREIVTDGASAADEDVAYYNDVFANYTITRSGTGQAMVTTISHVTVSNIVDPLTGGNLVSDGIDTLRNVEWAQFSDGTRVRLTNSPATGAPTITGTDDDLTVNTAGIQDENGKPTNGFSYQWQSSAAPGTGPWANVVGATAATINNVAAGTFYRVMVSYTDNSGFPESVVSEMTARVGTNGNDGTLAVPFSGSGAPNLLNGRNGNDVLDGLGGNDVINGGGGIDTVSYATATGSVTVNLATGAASGAGGNDTIATVENVVGSSFDDTITGNANDNVLSGGNGNDTYRFGSSAGDDDRINETAGSADRMTIATAGLALASLAVSDSDTGTQNGDLVVSFDGQQVTAVDHFDNTNEGIELINFDGGSFAGYQLGTGDYTISTADPANTGNPLARTVSVASGDNLMAGESGADRMTGGSGRDLLFGNAGNDILAGGAGEDLIVGGDGNDTIDGGAGNDTIVYDIDEGDGGSDVITGGADTDTLAIIDGGSTDAETLSVVYNGTSITQIEGGGSIAGIERITANLGAGTDTLAYTTTAAVNVDLSVGTASGFTSISGIENVTGGSGNDVFTGNVGNNAFTGGVGTDRAVFTGSASEHSFALAGANLVVSGAGGSDTLSGIEQLQFGATVYSTATGNLVQGTDASNAGITGGANAELILGFDGNDTINGNAGNDIIHGGEGTDTINAGDGDDLIVWNVGEGRDIVSGGANTAVGDTMVINGNAAGETFSVLTRAAWDAINGNNGALLAAATQIVITRNGVNFNSIVAELSGIEEIVINTGAGNDTVTTIGDFSPTGLAVNTITVNGDEGDDTVDISGLQSAHRILFRSNGGHDTIVGNLRPQDVVELAPGSDVSAYAMSTNANGTKTFSNGTHSVTFTGAVPPQFQNAPTTPGNDNGVTGNFAFTAADMAGLKNLINGLPTFPGDDDTEGFGGVRALSGHGNNEGNPDLGAADTPFIRITNAHFGEFDPATGNNAINPIFDGLDPRNISNILGAQEADLPKNASNANIFFMAFGQYFDHGLDFLPKGGNGTVQIGAPGNGFPGSGNPADLTRGTVYAIDENGVTQHINKTSPFVDQNQAYGSHELVGQFLRESDGNQGVGSHLLQGAADPSNPEFRLLPTLRELIQHHWQANTIFHDPALPGGQISFRDYYSNYPISETATGSLFDEVTGAFDPDVLKGAAANFMGSGHALLLDTNPFVSLLDHYVVGDGRGNENFALTAMHTIWARNHNYHVDLLEQSGFQGTAEELFQAAKIVNEAEYQRVVFTEFADMLIGGIRGDGAHGFEEYNPDASASISHEFAAAVYRVGHSLIGQTMTVLGPDGQPKQVGLFDAFLNPSNDPDVFAAPLPPGYVPQPGYEQLGVNSILGGIVTQQAEDVDFNIVDAVRNDLVRINADLFSFNVARAWDVGLGTLNQVRMDLAASQDPYVREAVGFAGDLAAYASWEDFQARNHLSDTVINQFRQAYPDLVLQPGDIASFKAINPGIEVAIQPDGTGIVKGIDRVDLWVGGLAEQHINDGMVGQTFWVVLHEQFDRLQEADRFYYLNRVDNFDFYEEFVDGQGFADIVARNTGLTNLSEHIFETEPLDDEDDGENQGGDDEDEDDGPIGPVDDDDDDQPSGGDGDDEDDDEDGEDDDGPSDGGNGDEDDDDLPSGGGGDGDDEDDDLPSGGGDENDDEELPSDGDDDDDDDVPDDGAVPLPVAARTLIGTVAADVLVGAAAGDTILAGAGGDILVGDGGSDILRGEDGDDVVTAGDGDDSVSGGNGDDELHGGSGDDMLFGNAGKDAIHGEAGHDFIEGGAGDDQVWAGAGNDTVIASSADGDDQYWGGDGIDTLDYSVATGNLTVDLGNGFMQRGQVAGGSTGTDIVYGFENVVTGSGHDTITATAAVNVIDGGLGNDTFRFLSAGAANGDTIHGFQPGDKIDFASIDADSATAGVQHFTLGSSLTAAGQIAVTHEVLNGTEFTVIHGNVDANTEADFVLLLKGNLNLTASDFNGIS
ncbi:peroxidase family protein [Rhizobium sp. 18055]|uniref:peroxidase family protein n=1 Tax=Rhizobium sp. 18055 TaxID=2681403 RepID=UPI00135BE596|nr:peroxidase family protein [Rhizobium sp. 18055]